MQIPETLAGAVFPCMKHIVHCSVWKNDFCDLTGMFIDCGQAQLRGVFASQLSPSAGLLCWTGSQSQWMEFKGDWVSINFKDLLLESSPGFAG